MEHPLDGALAHVDRADLEFDELKTLLESFIEKTKRELVANNDLRNTRGPVVMESHGVRMVPNIIVPLPAAVIVSGIIHHLRAALDYLVYELAIEDSGVVQDGTQFIIEDVKSSPDKSEVGFDARSRKYLKGVSKPHIEALEILQPYKGGSWTETLRDISNPDKHRKLTVILGHGIGSHRILMGAPGEFDGRPGQHLRRIGGGQDLYIEEDYSINIGFPERYNIPVLKTLHILKENVRATIDSFKPDFKRIRSD